MKTKTRVLILAGGMLAAGAALAAVEGDRSTFGPLAQSARSARRAEFLNHRRVSLPLHGPEAWLNMVGGNIRRDGIRCDLEALKGAGFSGIQFFHVGRNAEIWPGCEEQIPCLSEKWDDLVSYIGELITKNYYGRMAELAHAAGLKVYYETAFGDIVYGDLLEYW